MSSPVNPPLRGATARQIGRGLGWLSICSGAAKLLAPGRMATAAGMAGHPRVVARYGMREIATGIGILAARDPAPWIWGRAGGGALDAGTLVLSLLGRGVDRGRIARSLAVVAGFATLDLACAAILNHYRHAKPHPPQQRQSPIRPAPPPLRESSRVRFLGTGR